MNTYLRVIILCIVIAISTSMNIPITETNTSSRVIVVNPVPGLPLDFMRGVDLSEVPWILELGGRYYDENGVERDVLDILRDNGVNWIRLRVWNDPRDEHGVPYGGGNCDLERITSFASRAKTRGFKILVNFHYSDWWADPGKQYKPKTWVNLTFPELTRAVYNWTRDALIYMRNNNALPDAVQVGNEINNGFLWPDGRVENWTQFTTLLKSAIRAVRDVDPGIEIVIHLSGHREVDYYVNFFDRLIGDGVDFDIIGLSFYTYWHGSIEKLRSLVKTLAERYDKIIVLAEIAYPWTLEDHDGHPNLFGSRDMEIRGGYRATIQGQATLIRDMIEVLYREAGVKAGGVFYWGAGWIPIPGAGWKTNEGNPWENQALFDFNGRVLPSLRVFRLIYENTPVEIRPIELYDPASINTTTYIGVKPRLPGSVLVVYSDHSIKSTPVDWGIIPIYSQTGVYRLTGYVVNTSIRVDVLVEVREAIELTIPDPVGDDKGTGTYGYPKAAVYKPGVFDIVKTTISIIGEEVVFRIYFRDLGGNPWNSPNGFSLQYIHIYMRTSNPIVTGKTHRVDTFGVGIKLREDYAWQYALLISPGWGFEPLPVGELSALYYASGELFVEDRDFTVSANLGENYVEVRIHRDIIRDWENLEHWKIIVAATSWAGENPDRIRSFTPGGGDWVVDATAYADEKNRVKVISAMLTEVLPKILDIQVYSEEHVEGINIDQQYEWLMGFDPEKRILAVIPPPLIPYVTITHTYTVTNVETVTKTIVETTRVKDTVTETITVSATRIEHVIASALVAIAAGILIGYVFATRSR